MPSPSTLAGWLGWAGRHACRSMRAGPDPLRPGAARAARPAVRQDSGDKKEDPGSSAGWATLREIGRHGH